MVLGSCHAAFHWYVHLGSSIASLIQLFPSASPRCIHCGVVFMTLALLKVHIHEKHCEVFHKCSFCPMAFKSADSTVAHMTSQHSADPHKTTQ